MFRRTVIAQFGTAPRRKKNTPIAWHAAQRPAESSDIDFATLGLKYVPTHTPEVKIPKYYWTPPPTEKLIPGLPFFVERSSVSALPVYTDYKAGRTKVVTIVRRCRGDIDALKEEMEKVCGKEVTIRPGKLVVDGNYHIRLKKWLAGLGF